jgi:hypothetical protein
LVIELSKYNEKSCVNPEAFARRQLERCERFIGLEKLDERKAVGPDREGSMHSIGRGKGKC